MSVRDGGIAARIHRHRRAVLVTGLLAAIVSTMSAARFVQLTPTATGTTWYVSPGGDGTVGRSWSTAWKEPAQINWSVVNPGDRIVLDGGPVRCPSDYPIEDDAIPRAGVLCGVEYDTSLTVQANGTADAPVVIALSTSPGHNGTAVFFGGRATPLPYCDQQEYTPSGTGRAAGIVIDAQKHIVVDGSHRSGIMVYGARAGVDLHSDEASDITLRNLELFDNGTYDKWRYGYRTDGEGISLSGSKISIDRTLVHDNGQDAIQDNDTGVPGIGHAPLHDISLTNSWLYERREHPEWPGFGFNSGAQEVAAQDCTHVDGIQIWGGGLHQQRMTVAHDVFGPFLAQGVYPGEDNRTSFDDVVISDDLFLNALDHAIIGPAVASDPDTPADWQISHVTSYLTDVPNRGITTHGKIDLSGSGHSLTDSVFMNGYFNNTSAFAHAADNVWWGGDPVVGGTDQLLGFLTPPPVVRSPDFSALAHLDLAVSCPACAGAGSSLHDVGDLLHRIDQLDSGAAP